MTLTKTLTLLTILISASAIVSFAQISAQTDSKWEYTYYEEGIGKKRVNKASVVSEEDKRPDLSLNTNNAVIGFTVFKDTSEKHGWSTAFVISGEQFDCTRGCHIKYRFDDGKILGMWGYERNFKSLWFNDPRKFIEQMRGASIMEVEIPIWRRGTLVFKLNVAGFDEARMTEK